MTPPNGSTEKSDVAPTSSGSSHAVKPSSDWSGPSLRNNTMSGSSKTLHVADQPDPDQGDHRCQPRRRHSHRQQGNRRLMLTQPRPRDDPQAPAPKTNHILESQIHHFPGLDPPLLYFTDNQHSKNQFQPFRSSLRDSRARAVSSQSFLASSGRLHKGSSYFR